MKPPPFKYHAPRSQAEALGYLAKYGDEAKPLAGGQSLIPTMNFRLAQPEVLVDLNHLHELDTIRATDDGGVSIGAMTRQRAVERSPLVAERLPLLHETMPYIAHPQIRNRGTFGGSLAHTDPASELPAITTILNANFRVANQQRERWISAADFFVDLFETAIEADELLLEVVIPPLSTGTGYAFKEIARRHGDYAIAGVAATMRLADDGRCEAARLVYFSVGPKPMESAQAATMLQGQQPTTEAISAAVEAAVREELDPHGDIHASEKYRRHLAKVLGQQVLTQAAQRAKTGS